MIQFVCVVGLSIVSKYHNKFAWSCDTSVFEIRMARPCANSSNTALSQSSCRDWSVQSYHCNHRTYAWKSVWKPPTIAVRTVQQSRRTIHASRTSSPARIQLLGLCLKTYRLRRKLVQVGDIGRFYTRGRHEALSVCHRPSPKSSEQSHVALTSLRHAIRWLRTVMISVERRWWDATHSRPVISRFWSILSIVWHLNVDLMSSTATLCDPTALDLFDGPLILHWAFDTYSAYGFDLSSTLHN